jgi:hypothetical protein
MPDFSRRERRAPARQAEAELALGVPGKWGIMDRHREGIFGLCWGYVAWRTRTIRWSVYSHILTNIAGMAAITFIMQGVVTL